MIKSTDAMRILRLILKHSNSMVCSFWCIISVDQCIFTWNQ